MIEKSKENRLRRELQDRGYLLRKSRAQEGIDNFGGYLIIDGRNNAVVAGSRFELDLDDVSEWIDSFEGVKLCI